MNNVASKPLITDPEVLAIDVEDNGEPLVNIKHNPEIAYGPVPECPQSAPFYTKMRAGVFDRLLAAQQLLPDGIKFRLYEGLRDFEVQRFLFDQMYGQNEAQCPELSEELLFLQTTKLVSPVVNLDGSENIPPHCTGAAVDVELIDAEGNLLDMGMQAKDWMTYPAHISETDCVEISLEAQQNRQLLLKVMTEVGFVNYHTEWWHYSYGDKYWAYMLGKPKAIYGLV